MIKNKHSAFTLAEMMIVMLILTILLAAFAPLMTKKSKVDLSNPWRWASNNSDIYYGIGSNQTAMIGQNNKAAGDPNAKLLINQSDEDNPYISFKNGNNTAGGIFIDPTRGSLWMHADARVDGEDLDGDTAFGIDAMSAGNSYYAGTAFGYGAMRYSNGARNTAVGAHALEGQADKAGHIEAGDNTAIGHNALQDNQVGSYSNGVALGSNNTAIGSGALAMNTTGHDNTAVGYNACLRMQVGNNLTCIGSETGPAASINASNAVFIGNASVDRIFFAGMTARTLATNVTEFTPISDKRLKENITANQSGLNEIRKLKVYNYNFKNSEQKTKEVGVMAQDLQQIFPNAVTKDENGYLHIRKADMFYGMVNAIKELDKMIQDLVAQVKTVVAQVANHDTQIKALQKENKELKNKVQTLEKQNKSFEARLKAIEKKL